MRCVLDAMQPVSRRRAYRSPRVIEAHARSLQHLFRRLQSLAARRAARGGDGRAWGRGLMRGLLPVWRPVIRYACGGGTNLASDAAFDAQRRLAERVLLWYRQYPDLLRKLSKRAPAVVDLFCGGGGCSEGIRRAGIARQGWVAPRCCSLPLVTRTDSSRWVTITRPPRAPRLSRSALSIPDGWRRGQRAPFSSHAQRQVRRSTTCG